MNRRFLIGGVLCAGAAVLAQELKPHRYVSLLQQAKLDDLVPRRFGAWTSEDVGDPLALNAPGTLSAKLYNQLVTRAYSNPSGQRILMLLAYGERQSDELQLHRPETCYPAFGFQLLRNEPTMIGLSPTVSLPARELLAKSDQQEERVVYWTRLGESFPASKGEQRRARFHDALSGIVPDGVLCRFSTPEDAAGSWNALQKFLRELIAATGPRGLRVLIGTQRASLLSQHA
jgi:EpsI family protein